jgi:hypothetical protein
MRSIPLTLVALSLALPAMAQEHDADRTIAGGGKLAEGWMARTDRGQDFSNVRFTETATGWEVSVGPGVVFYRDSDVAEGSYTISADFEQLSSKGHAHGVGLIFGGADLQAEGQVYTYVLVRGDGNYLVKTRTGSETAYVTQWTEHASINQSPEGHVTNTMSVRVTSEDVTFMINGQEVHKESKADLYTDGVVGFRMNHNVDMRVHNFKIERGD